MPLPYVVRSASRGDAGRWLGSNCHLHVITEGWDELLGDSWGRVKLLIRMVEGALGALGPGFRGGAKVWSVVDQESGGFLLSAISVLGEGFITYRLE